MPQAYVKKLAEKHGVAVTEAEKKWSAAKEQASKNGQSQNYGYITQVFKSMMGEKTESAALKRFLARASSIKPSDVS